MLISHLIFLLLLMGSCTSASDYVIKLSNNGPIVKGGTITFKAVVYDSKGVTNDEIKFVWNDGAIPMHTRETDLFTNGTDTWNVTYDSKVYPAGAYIVQVVIKKCWVITSICYEVDSLRQEFVITTNLNGDLALVQKNKTLSKNVVSTKDELINVIDIKSSDLDFIAKAPSIQTYWFVDCIYYGITSDFDFPFNFTIADQSHVIESLVVVDFSPPVPSTTTTTTSSSTTTTSTTTPSTTTTTTSKTTIKPKSVTKREVVDDRRRHNDAIKVWKNGSLVAYNVDFPYVCNSTYIPTDPDKIYGYFYRMFHTKDPLTKVNVTGNNWLQPGDLLALKVRCDGSSNFKYCVRFVKGEYNVTGNETCESYVRTDVCAFDIRRYLSYPKSTIVIIIENDLSKQVTPVTVNIYKVKKEGQLSVIVVPVAFSLAAVVIIVFGVAYYFQNRNRFIIEVADFNFGQQYADLEYKTFSERLRDSLANAITRDPSPSASEAPVWPPGRKYGSMT